MIITPEATADLLEQMQIPDGDSSSHCCGQARLSPNFR